MWFGVYNAILHDRSLPEALEVVGGLGLTGIELNSGRLPARRPHPDVRRRPHLRRRPRRVPRAVRGDRRGDRRAEMQRQPAASGPGHRRRARRGHPAQHPPREPAGPAPRRYDVGAARQRARRQQPTWVVNAWNSAALDVLDYQWGVSEAFWREIDREAADLDVKVALELHAQNIVFNPAGIRELDRTHGRHAHRGRAGRVASVLAMDGPGRRGAGPWSAGVPRRRQGRQDQSGRRGVRGARQPVPPAVARRAPDEPRRRRVSERVAEGGRVGLRRARPRSRRRLLVDVARRAARRSTRTWS